MLGGDVTIEQLVHLYTWTLPVEEGFNVCVSHNGHFSSVI